MRSWGHFSRAASTGLNPVGLGLDLGLCTPEKAAALEAHGHALSGPDKVSVLYDFEVPASKNTRETITAPARVARSRIPKNTKNIPRKLVSVVEHLSAPLVQPVLAEGAGPSRIPDHIKRHARALGLKRYACSKLLARRICEDVIAPIEAHRRNS